jgi:hypothetical protein
MVAQSKPQYAIKVYKIWYEDAPEEFYIGSTKYDTLYKRMSDHRNKVKEGKKSKLYQLIRSKGGGFKYSQIALCMVSCKDEQRAFEQNWIDKLHPTLNMSRAYGIDIERDKQRQKEYKQRPERKQKQKEYYSSKKRTCVCGVEYSANQSYAQIHYSAQWHQEYISNLPYPLNGGNN